MIWPGLSSFPYTYVRIGKICLDMTTNCSLSETLTRIIFGQLRNRNFINRVLFNDCYWHCRTFTCTCRPIILTRLLYSRRCVLSFSLINEHDDDDDDDDSTEVYFQNLWSECSEWSAFISLCLKQQAARPVHKSGWCRLQLLCTQTWEPGISKVFGC